MAEHTTERTPLLNSQGHDTSSQYGGPERRAGTSGSEDNKPHHINQNSTVDCEAHPEDCPMVTGVGLLALDGGWGWIIVIATMLCNFLQASMSRTFGVVYPTIQQRFNSSAVATTTIQSISNGLRLFGAIFSSSLCERVGVRRLVIVGGCLQALGYGISALAPDIYFLYFSMGILTGIGGLLTYAPTHILVNKYFYNKKGIALGLATSGVGIGTFLMAPLQTMLLIQYGYVGYCIMMCGILLNYVVGAALMRPIESNHTAHRVATANMQRQKSRQQRRLHASMCSTGNKPNVFYETEYVFDPKPGWERDITGRADSPIGSLPDMAAGPFSNTAVDSTSKISANTDTNMSTSMPASLGYLLTTGDDRGRIESSNVDNSNMLDSNNTAANPKMADSILTEKSNMDKKTKMAANGTATESLYPSLTDAREQDFIVVDTEKGEGETKGDHEQQEKEKEIMGKQVTDTEQPEITFAEKQQESRIKNRKPQRSVTINAEANNGTDAATKKFSFRRGLSESYRHEEAFLGSFSGSYSPEQESFTSSIKHVSKELAFVRKQFDLFTRLAFVLYCAQNTVLQFCTAAPLVFLPLLGVENGYSETASAFLISVSGIFDIVGRYVFGPIFDVPVIIPRRRLIHGILGLLLGTATICIGFTRDYASMFATAAFHGMMAGGFHGQKTAIATEFVDMNRMPVAVGFVFFFEGFGSLIAAPLFGLTVDAYSTYRLGYYGCGGIFIFFTLLVLIEYCVYRPSERRAKR